MRTNNKLAGKVSNSLSESDDLSAASRQGQTVTGGSLVMTWCNTRSVSGFIPSNGLVRKENFLNID